ncbi:uncharacterized protein EI90DRAFT_3116065 [Cantharellus anzutake]|uniref:uncharacterized protein n=1 Tax=Cantharellus anzutake TaxID=1750568 RepID=UPI001905F7B6|nr:uncharacterized protein EI90DRAFT_3116065 [Cantharellus anzutake]KAF8342164.1 hypothetical protein EI90DRAFT_3116065 [Cantharellus anzutake]
MRNIFTLTERARDRGGRIVFDLNFVDRTLDAFFLGQLIVLTVGEERTSTGPPKQALAWKPSVLGNNLPAGASAPGTPQLQLWGYANFIYEVAQPHVISIPEGHRVNVKLIGSNWTNPDGSLLANVVPGIGGEEGYVDTKGVFHVDVRYVAQFVSDGKYAYVQLKGNGTAGRSNKVTMSVTHLQLHSSFYLDV